jgi:hypothetical protein
MSIGTILIIVAAILFGIATFLSFGVVAGGPPAEAFGWLGLLFAVLGRLVP